MGKKEGDRKDWQDYCNLHPLWYHQGIVVNNNSCRTFLYSHTQVINCGGWRYCLPNSHWKTSTTEWIWQLHRYISSKGRPSIATGRLSIVVCGRLFIVNDGLCITTGGGLHPPTNFRWASRIFLLFSSMISCSLFSSISLSSCRSKKRTEEQNNSAYYTNQSSTISRHQKTKKLVWHLLSVKEVVGEGSWGSKLKNNQWWSKGGVTPQKIASTPKFTSKWLPTKDYPLASKIWACKIWASKI